MTDSIRPRIRSLELVPLGESEEEMFALRDPHGFSGTVALPAGAAMLVTLMNGQRTLGELRQAFERKIGRSLTIPDIEKIVNQLDQRYFLDNERFAEYRAEIINDFQQRDARPTAHAGLAYAADPESLRSELTDLFNHENGPKITPEEGLSRCTSAATTGLCGLVTPHFDFKNAGPTIAWAYDRLVTESEHDLFVILATAHTPLKGFYSVSQKHFETPFGTVETDRDFIETLVQQMSAVAGPREAVELINDELPHRLEHSIEFPALMLQYALGVQRQIKIVPILVGSFHPFVLHGRRPSESPAVCDFVFALQKTLQEYPRDACLIASVDMAHIGPQFGDPEPLDELRLKEQWTIDQNLLATACTGKAHDWFAQIVDQNDRYRICGLAPIYTLLETLHPSRGELLKYDQSVSQDRHSCVTFASVAYYE